MFYLLVDQMDFISVFKIILQNIIIGN